MRKARNDGSSSLPPELPGCGEWVHELTLFVDGELGEAERTEIELHLDECRLCQNSVDYSLAFRSALRQKTRSTALTPAPFRERLQLVLAQEAVPSTSSLSSWFGLKKLWSPVPAAAAGATALGITAWLWFGGATDDVVKEIVARHARHLPLEIQSNDPRSLEAWLVDKVDFRVKVPRTTLVNGASFSLMGARLSHVLNHSAVQVLYGTQQSPTRSVSMLVFDDPSIRTPMMGIPHRVGDVDVYEANRAGYNVAVWRNNEIVYSLVSDGEDDMVDALVRASK